MPLSPYTAVPQLHSNPNSGLNLNQFSSAVRPISSHSRQSPLRRASLGYSPYSSDLSAASAESPLSSSSANESPLPEPSIDNMDYDTSAQVASGNDDYYPCTLSDDIAGLYLLTLLLVQVHASRTISRRIFSIRDILCVRC
ncbi:hypothetical protein PAXINDRAFT_16999 [Paxillus involutus ATCC 200175]|uniref:Uncharacterized protein n=1 Tax=Paxillus involutus ATCC 200175 TaxID=664439 RepID=A0A0C9T2L4_PAXIN|nr:hypothetical protein PAXINDRAFT_16999 [Paxillus involutus ATCC 200175]